MTIPTGRLRKAVEFAGVGIGYYYANTSVEAKNAADFAAELLILQPWAEKARKVLEDFEGLMAVCYYCKEERNFETDKKIPHAPDCAIAALLKDN